MSRKVFDLLAFEARDMTPEEEVHFDEVTRSEEDWDRGVEKWGYPPVGVSVELRADGWYHDGVRLNTTPRVVDVAWKEEA